MASSENPNYSTVAGFFDAFAETEDAWLRRTGGYHERVRGIYRSLVPPDQRVLEVGCGRGDLLAALAPARGVGLDVSSAMVALARDRHPRLEFTCLPGEMLDLDESFDYIVMSDVVPYVDDLQTLFGAVAAHCHPRSRVVISVYSHAWRPLLATLQRLGVRPSRPVRNRVAPRDLVNLAELAGLEVVSERKEMLAPVRSRAVSLVANGFLARLPLLRELTLTHWLVARPAQARVGDRSVSVVVPCRNEARSVAASVQRIPTMGAGTEIVFVEGGSTDDTRARIEAEIEGRPDRDLKLVSQTGAGKWNAVQSAARRRAGSARSSPSGEP